MPFVSPPEPPVPIRLYELEPATVPGDVAGGAAAPGIAGDDRVLQRRRALVVQAAAVAVAELPLIVQSVRVAVPPIDQAAAVAGGVAADGAVDERGRRRRRLSSPPPSSLAEFPLRVQSVSVAVPWLYRPPPSALVEPPVMVRPEMAAVTPASTWNTRLVPPPLMVNARLPGR